MEEFKPVPFCEEYSVSNLGRVKNNRTGRILKCWDSNGYEYCRIIKDKKHIKTGVHRLVCICFLDNPENLPEVDHIDRNRKNNKVDNLRWCSRVENSLNKSLEDKARKNNKLQEHHICNAGKKFIVQIRGKYLGIFGTIGEAKSCRDKNLEQINKYGLYHCKILSKVLDGQK